MEVPKYKVSDLFANTIMQGGQASRLAFDAIERNAVPSLDRISMTDTEAVAFNVKHKAPGVGNMEFDVLVVLAM